jgi:8-amino-7-oxononanoate synthase
VPRPLVDRLSRDLAERRERHLLRAIPGPLPDGARGRIDLAANSYCGLHENAAVADEARRLAAGVAHGNLASRLIRETSPLAGALEIELAQWKQTEAALLFNSGYAANVGILQALCTRNTEVFCDRLNHASIIDGIRLSGAKMQRYRHCDMADLARRLAGSAAGEKIIVTDAVFSMDGDRAPLAAIVDLAQRNDVCVMVDEAHAAGVLGAHGSGLAEETGVAAAIDIRMGTLSKAVAGLGGFFAGSALLREYLVNHSRSLIYSTGLPAAVIAFDLAAVRYLRANPFLGATLLSKAVSFREKLHHLGFDTLGSTTQIVPCLTGDDGEALALSAFLAGRGIDAPAVRPPTVPSRTARIRFSVTLGFTAEHEATVIAALAEWKSRRG